MRAAILVLVTFAIGCRNDRTAETTAAPPGKDQYPPVHIVVEGVFELDVPGPVLKEPGSDAESGLYELWRCRIGYDVGPRQSGLEPGALGFPEEYLHRVTEVHGLPVRWVTYLDREDPRGMDGRYRLALYRPGVRIMVACYEREARDRAMTWFSTVRFVPRDVSDSSGVKLVGPSTFSPAPDLCTQSQEPPIGGTSVATVRIEVPKDTSISVFTLRSPALPDPLEWIQRHNPGAPPEQFVPAGTYSIDIEADRLPPVRCAPVELRPGQVTTVRVQRFHM